MPGEKRTGPWRVLVLGAEDTQRTRMGLFTEVGVAAVKENRRRPIFRNAHGQYLYYWAPHRNWKVGPDYSRASCAMSSADRSGAAWPTLAGDWRVWDGRRWSGGDVVRVVEDPYGDEREDAFTVTTAESSLPALEKKALEVDLCSSRRSPESVLASRHSSALECVDALQLDSLLPRHSPTPVFVEDDEAELPPAEQQEAELPPAEQQEARPLAREVLSRAYHEAHRRLARALRAEARALGLSSRLAAYRHAAAAAAAAPAPADPSAPEEEVTSVTDLGERVAEEPLLFFKEEPASVPANTPAAELAECLATGSHSDGTERGESPEQVLLVAACVKTTSNRVEEDASEQESVAAELPAACVEGEEVADPPLLAGGCIEAMHETAAWTCEPRESPTQDDTPEEEEAMGVELPAKCRDGAAASDDEDVAASGGAREPEGRGERTEEKEACSGDIFAFVAEATEAELLPDCIPSSASSESCVEPARVENRMDSACCIGPVESHLMQAEAECVDVFVPDEDARDESPTQVAECVEPREGTVDHNVVIAALPVEVGDAAAVSNTEYRVGESSMQIPAVEDVLEPGEGQVEPIEDPRNVSGGATWPVGIESEGYVEPAVDACVLEEEDAGIDWRSDSFCGDDDTASDVGSVEDGNSSADEVKMVSVRATLFPVPPAAAPPRTARGPRPRAAPAAPALARARSMAADAEGSVKPPRREPAAEASPRAGGGQDRSLQASREKVIGATSARHDQPRARTAPWQPHTFARRTVSKQRIRPSATLQLEKPQASAVAVADLSVPEMPRHLGAFLPIYRRALRRAAIDPSTEAGGRKASKGGEQAPLSSRAYTEPIGRAVWGVQELACQPNGGDRQENLAAKRQLPPIVQIHDVDAPKPQTAPAANSWVAKPVEKDEEPPQDPAATAYAQVVDFLMQHEGSALSAWLNHFDTDHNHCISREEFISGMKRMGWNREGAESAESLFQLLDADASGQLVLDEIDAGQALLWRQFRHWCAATFTGLDDLVSRLLPRNSLADSTAFDTFKASLDRLGWSGSCERLLFQVLGIGEDGHFHQPSLSWFEADRRRWLRKEESRMRSSQQQMKLLSQRHAAAALLEDFKAFLLKRHSSLLHAWRCLLCPDDSLLVKKPHFLKVCSANGWRGDGRLLWQALDRDDSGDATLDEFDAHGAVVLAHLQQLVMEGFGSASGFFARLDRSRRNHVRLDDFTEVLTDLGFRFPVRPLFHALDRTGTQMLSEKDMQFLDHWKPRRWTLVRPNLGAAEEVRELLLNHSGHLFKAWRQLLDRHGNNRCHRSEFEDACKKIGYTEDVAGAWRALDQKVLGHITFAELEPASSRSLVEFRRWALSEFGTVRAAFEMFTDDGADTLTHHQLVHACRLFGWRGDVTSLIRTIDSDANGSISWPEVEWLDHWIGGDDEMREASMTHPGQSPGHTQSPAPSRNGSKKSAAPTTDGTHSPAPSRKGSKKSATPKDAASQETPGAQKVTVRVPPADRAAWQSHSNPWKSPRSRCAAAGPLPPVKTVVTALLEGRRRQEEAGRAPAKPRPVHAVSTPKRLVALAS